MSSVTLEPGMFVLVEPEKDSKYGRQIVFLTASKDRYSIATALIHLFDLNKKPLTSITNVVPFPASTSSNYWNYRVIDPTDVPDLIMPTKPVILEPGTIGRTKSGAFYHIFDATPQDSVLCCRMDSINQIICRRSWDTFIDSYDPEFKNDLMYRSITSKGTK